MQTARRIINSISPGLRKSSSDAGVRWYSTVDEAQLKHECITEPQRYIRSNRVHKHALLIGYCSSTKTGAIDNNASSLSVSRVMLDALKSNNWAVLDNRNVLVDRSYAVRTLAACPAVRQVLSIPLPESFDVKKMNSMMPADVRIFGAQRVIDDFKAHPWCNAQTYSYTMPSIALAKKEVFEGAGANWRSFRIDAETLRNAREYLTLYEGIKNFHKYTYSNDYHDPLSYRCVLSSTCSTPFLGPENVEFVTLKIKGRSFLLTQIRKMVGMLILIMSGMAPTDFFHQSFEEPKLSKGMPTAPNRNLVLEAAHFYVYNDDDDDDDSVHELLTWEPQQEADALAFAEEHIYSKILQAEAKQSCMMNWLNSNNLRAFDQYHD